MDKKATMDSSVESVDWRSRLPSNLRQKLLEKIIDTLSKHAKISGDKNEVKNVAIRFEEKAFTAATSHSDYINKISVKLMTIEKRSTNTATSSLHHSTSAANPAHPSESGSQSMQQVNNQGQPAPVVVTSNHPILPQNIHTNIASSALPNIASQTSSLQTMPQFSIGNSTGQGIRVPTFSSQRQVPGSQQQAQSSQNYSYQPHLHQIAKQQLQQSNSTSNIQQQKLNPSHFQSSQRSIMQQPTMLQPSFSTVQHNQLPVFSQSSQPVSQQSVLKQQRHQQQQPRLMAQQPSSGQHNNFSAIHHQHFAPQSSSPKQQLLQSTQSQRSQMELQQQGMQQLSHLQRQSIVKLQGQGDLQQRLPGSFHQQKQLSQQQRAKPEPSSTSSDSTAQTGNPNGGDWQEEAYQKIITMKDKYLLHLKDMHQITISKLRQNDNLLPQQIEKMKTCLQNMENYMSVLQFDKTKISLIHKDKLGVLERSIVGIISYLKGAFGIALPQPHTSSLHQSQAKPRENQMNSQMQSVNLQQNNMTILQNNNMGIMQPSGSLLQHPQYQHFLHKQLQQKQHQFPSQTKQQQQQQNSELKVRQQIGMKSESLQQHQQSKSFSSPQIDQQNAVSKSGTPIQSPFIGSSPSTPSTSHMPIDSEKLSNVVNIGHQQTSPSQPLAIGISPSPLLAEFSSPDGNGISGKSTTVEDPMEHLLRVVKSVSPESLSAACITIGSVLSMMDSIAESEGKRSVGAVGENLAAMTKLHLQRTSVNHDTTAETRNTKHFDVVSSASHVIDNLNHTNCQEANLELESTATSTIKRPRVEKRQALLDEIREINEALIDTVVDVSQLESEVGKGTVVKCSFTNVSLCPVFKSQYPALSIQPLWLLVPENYPYCSPILIEKSPVEISKENDLSLQAKCRFSSFVRMHSDPIALKEMARTWDLSAREVIVEYAQQTGGGSFTSKYGSWDDCFPDA